MTDPKILNLEDMQNMPIESIVDLYRNGYRLETMQCPAGCTPTMNPVYVLLGGIAVGTILIWGTDYLRNRSKQPTQ